METQSIDDNCDVASESSISWSGGEGHEGDDELTDWAPSMDNPSIIDQSPWNDTDPREIRAGNVPFINSLQVCMAAIYFRLSKIERGAT